MPFFCALPSDCLTSSCPWRAAGRPSTGAQGCRWEPTGSSPCSEKALCPDNIITASVMSTAATPAIRETQVQSSWPACSGVASSRAQVSNWPVQYVDLTTTWYQATGTGCLSLPCPLSFPLLLLNASFSLPASCPRITPPCLSFSCPPIPVPFLDLVLFSPLTGVTTQPYCSVM